jgi:hypothetical protein
MKENFACDDRMPGSPLINDKHATMPLPRPTTECGGIHAGSSVPFNVRPLYCLCTCWTFPTSDASKLLNILPGKSIGKEPRPYGSIISVIYSNYPPRTERIARLIGCQPFSITSPFHVAHIGLQADHPKSGLIAACFIKGDFQSQRYSKMQRSEGRRN